MANVDPAQHQSLVQRSEKIWRKIGKLSLATVLLLAISLSWSVIVDLTPADQRPYIGSSSNNSTLNLIIGYNGAQRLLGMFGRGGANRPLSGLPNSGQRSEMENPPAFVLNGNHLSSNTPNGGAPFNRPDEGNGMQPGGGPGGFNIGQPGALRLFISPLNKEVSWLLPFGLISAIWLAAGSRWLWPINTRHQALVLWGGWLITCVVFFSVAGFFHEYYLSMMGAPLAALAAIGIGEMWSLAKTRPWISAGVLSVSVLVTLGFQIYTARDFVQNVWWLPVVTAVFLLGLLALVVPLLSQKGHQSMAAGFALISLAMLITPLVWSAYTTLSASQNQSLPSSYSGGKIGPVTQRDLQIDQSLLEYLQANTKEIEYLMAVPSAMQGADYVLASGRPVLYIGGFNGNDQVVTAEDLAQMVTDGELRYVYWNADGRGVGANSDISTAPSPNWFVAIIFYLLFVVGLLVFVVLPGLRANSLKTTLLHAALFGLITYATYDLTNLATLKDWPALLSIVDILWGVALSVLVSYISFMAGMRLIMR